MPIRLGARTDCDVSGGRSERKSVPVEGVGGSGLSDNSEDHSELVGDETLTPKVILGVEHSTVLESREPDAIQVETPDDHLGVEAEGRDEEDEGDEGERG